MVGCERTRQLGPCPAGHHIVKRSIHLFFSSRRGCPARAGRRSCLHHEELERRQLPPSLSQPCVSPQAPLSLFLPTLQAGRSPRAGPGDPAGAGRRLQLSSHPSRLRERWLPAPGLWFLHTPRILSAAWSVPTGPFLSLAKPHLSLKFEAHVAFSGKPSWIQFLSPLLAISKTQHGAAWIRLTSAPLATQGAEDVGCLCAPGTYSRAWHNGSL